MTTRFLSFLLILLGMAFPAAAQTPAQTPDPPRFLLESVVVEGVQRDAVRQIVTSESLLQPGREYTEQELREAVYRIKRLPFVLDAEFALRKGGERGSYQLVITVEETRLFFFSADVGGQYDGTDERFDPEDDRIDWGASASVGGRWFVGSQGLVFASVQGFDTVGPSTAQAGYTRYNLFGRGGFASVALLTDVSDELDGDAWQGGLSVGLPIVGNHSLRADLSWSESENNTFFNSRNESRNFGLAWIYDTTDDPIFPTSGTRLVGGTSYSESEQRSEFDDVLFRDSIDSYGFSFGARRHWALTGRQSVSAEMLSAWYQYDADSDPTGDEYEQWNHLAVFTHSTDLWGFAKTERFGDFRWENSLQAYGTEGDSAFSRFTSIDGRLTTALVFRNAWGVTRLSFSYIENLDQESRVRNVL
jgi:hypothetical protein